MKGPGAIAQPIRIAGQCQTLSCQSTSDRRNAPNAVENGIIVNVARENGRMRKRAGSTKGLSDRTQCTTNPRAGLAFGGQSGTMILSRYPLSDTETVVLPGTWNRRVITRATATLPNGARVGVYCNHLTPVFEGSAFPYTGRYGCGQTGREGWVAEQTAQARALIAYVQRRDASGRAIILGDFNSGPGSRAGQPEIVEAAPETYAVLTGAFREAVPAGYVPQCTFCPDNALTDNSAPEWIDHIFLRGFATDAVRRAERTFTTASVNVQGRAQPVHVSDHYGMRAVLSVAP